MRNDKQETQNACRSLCGKGSCCLDCHFLMKSYRAPNFAEWKSLIADAERSRLARGEPPDTVVGENYTLACFQNVWDWANRGKDSENDLARVLNYDRGTTCFFYPYTPGMFFPAAAELEQRGANRREASRDRKVALWSIVAGLVAVLLGPIITKLLG